MSIPVIPETTLGDLHVYSSLVVTLVTAADSFIFSEEPDNSSVSSNKQPESSDSIFIFRVLIFLVGIAFPLFVYIITIKHYLTYKGYLPSMEKQPKQVKRDGGKLDHADWQLDDIRYNDEIIADFKVIYSA